MEKAAPEPFGRGSRAFERICNAVAMAGGVLLIAIMLVSSVSVIGRSLSHVFGAKVSGIPGDIELVQLGCAVAVFAFLPLCQLMRANVLVGAFTKNLPVRYRAMFDLAANLLFLVLAVMLAWQLGQGTAEKFRNNDTTMVLRIPEGWAYAAALAFAWLLVVVTAYTVARSALEIGTNRAIGPKPSGEH
jgi:TRAP-type C4-dicarboxylate transport system permease small subunit